MGKFFSTVGRVGWAATKTGVRGIGTLGKNILFDKQHHFDFKTQMVGAGLNIALSLALSGPTAGDKAAAIGWSILGTTMFAGFKSPTTQIMGSLAFAALPYYPGMAKAYVGAHRNTLEARTSAAIPFSHSSVQMNYASAMMQYAHSRISEFTGPTMGTEAMMYSARYTSR